MRILRTWLIVSAALVAMPPIAVAQTAPRPYTARTHVVSGVPTPATGVSRLMAVRARTGQITAACVPPACRASGGYSREQMGEPSDGTSGSP